MWDNIKTFFRTVLDNLVTAMRRLVNEEYEFGTGERSESNAEFIASRFTALVVVAAGLFFVLYPFQNNTMMTVGDNLMRTASYMWNGAT